MMAAGHRALARRVIEGRLMPCQAWREVGLRRVVQCSRGYGATVIDGFALVARLTDWAMSLAALGYAGMARRYG